MTSQKKILLWVLSILPLPKHVRTHFWATFSLFFAPKIKSVKINLGNSQKKGLFFCGTTFLTIGTPILAKLTSASTVPTSTYVQYPNPQKAHPASTLFSVVTDTALWLILHLFLPIQFNNAGYTWCIPVQMPALQSKGHALPLGQEQRISHLKTTFYFLSQGPVFLISNPICICSADDSRVFQILKPLCISSDKRWVFLISNPLCVSLGRSPAFLT